MTVSHEQPACGDCGDPLTGRESGFTGASAYHEACARRVYGDAYRPPTPTCMCPADECHAAGSDGCYFGITSRGRNQVSP